VNDAEEALTDYSNLPLEAGENEPENKIEKSFRYL
jgi:hypothetical protein